MIVDLDGTLASVEWRTYHLQRRPRDWRAFFAGMGEDAPVPWVVEFLRAEHGEATRLIVTGRPEDYRTVCEDWLERHAIPYEALLMRSRGDHRPDHVVKGELYDQAIARRYRVALVIDDRPGVVAMWRERGLYVVVPTDPGLPPFAAPPGGVGPG